MRVSIGGACGCRARAFAFSFGVTVGMAGRWQWTASGHCPQATTVTVESAHTDSDTAIRLAIDFYYANRNTITTVLYPRKNRSPSRIKKTGISIRRVAAIHKISFSQLQHAIAAGGEHPTRSEAHEAEMVLAIAEEAVLEEWCLRMQEGFSREI